MDAWSNYTFQYKFVDQQDTAKTLRSSKLIHTLTIDVCPDPQIEFELPVDVTSDILAYVHCIVLMHKSYITSSK